MTLIRTHNQGCWQLTSNAWGQYLRPAPDPDSDLVLTDEQLKGFELHDNITPIPAELWQRWVQLAFAMTQRNHKNLEVSCRLLRHEDDKTRWRILVPKQQVGPASVRVKSFDEACDIETGEIISQYPPPGWVPAGSSHSHNTMAAFFSGTDDQFELGDPGLHIVVGSIDLTTRQYVPKASITANKRRFDIPYQAVIDTTPLEVAYHERALEMVELEPAPAPLLLSRRPAGSGWGFGFRSGGRKIHKRTSTAYDGYSSWHDDDYGLDDAWMSQQLGAATQGLVNRPAGGEPDDDDPLNAIRAYLNELPQQMDSSLAIQLEELTWQIMDLVQDFYASEGKL